ncbi:MAG: cation diffusion facilitator family transporter [Verrucomicrobiales bacterium]|nr:cation diffusion facilitator family transporter [Verrucomicrobiales bacterium]
MSHHHHHSRENLKVAFFLNLGFTVVEIIGGLWTNSVAILTDAVHDLGDSLSLGLAWYFDRLSEKGRTPSYTYGYRRYRLIGGLITGVILIIGLSFALWHSIARIFDPAEVNAGGMMGLAVLGILFNGAAVLRVRRGSSLTEKLVSWHLIEDVLGWVAVLIGAGIMMIWDLPVIDSLLSIGISLFILWNVGGSLRKVGAVFLQTTPEGFEVSNFEKAVLKIEGVESIHHVHCWSIDGESHVLSAHLVISNEAEDIVSIKNAVRRILADDAFEHVTLEIERPGDCCPQREPSPERGETS